MKILIMLMMLVFGNAVYAGHGEKEELFSPGENVKIVRAIDYICGDIWCEGYYDYKFIDLSCDKKNHDCDLRFQFKESFDDRRVELSPVQVCHVDGIYSLDQVMEDERYLKFEFIDKLNGCFEELAEQYHGR